MEHMRKQLKESKNNQGGGDNHKGWKGQKVKKGKLAFKVKQEMSKR